MGFPVDFPLNQPIDKNYSSHEVIESHSHFSSSQIGRENGAF